MLELVDLFVVSSKRLNGNFTNLQTNESFLRVAVVSDQQVFGQDLTCLDLLDDFIAAHNHRILFSLDDRVAHELPSEGWIRLCKVKLGATAVEPAVVG